MARVLCATQPWGFVTDDQFHGLPTTTFAITTLPGVAVKVYTAATGNTEITAYQTDTRGVIPGWIDVGTYLLTCNGVTAQIEAVSGTSLPSPMQLTPASAAQALLVNPTGAVSPSTSAGGAVKVDNSLSTGAGVVIYSTRGSDAGGRLLVVRSDNIANPQQALYVENHGTGHAVSINHSPNAGDGKGTNSNALVITSANDQDTALGVSGSEAGKGTIKATHNKPAGSDANASALSLRANGAGTAAQFIFADAEQAGGTTGKMINMRQNGVERFVVGNDGDITIGGHNLNDYFGARRAANIMTLPDMMVPSTSGLSSGTVFAGVAFARKAGTFNTIRMIVTAATTPTDIKMGVWDANGVLLAQSVQVASMPASTNYIENVLATQVTLTENQRIYLGCGYVGGGTMTLRTSFSTIAMLGARGFRAFNLSVGVAGWAGGNLPALPSPTNAANASTTIPWLELA